VLLNSSFYFWSYVYSTIIDISLVHLILYLPDGGSIRAIYHTDYLDFIYLRYANLKFITRKENL
jgi:hypothetical protein